MATPPKICETVIGTGVIFDNCSFYFTKSGSPGYVLDLCDFRLDINDFFMNEFCLYAQTSQNIVMDSVNTTQPGEVSFIAIKVKYPSTVLTENKYLNFLYKSVTYPLGDLMILTGNPKAGFTGHGIDLDPNGSDIISPILSLGGILLENPHTYKVNIQVLVGY